MKISYTLASIITAAITTQAAFAASIQQTGTFTDDDDSLTLDETTTSIPGFNSSLGTLTGINVEFTQMVLTASADIRNNDNSNSTAVNDAAIGYRVSSGVPTLTGPGVASLTFPNFGLNLEVILDGAGAIAPSSTEAFSGGPTPSDLVLATSFNVGSGDFGLYTDTSVNFDVDGVGATTISFTGGLPEFINFSLTGSGTVNVIYTYDEAVLVPEPSSTALLGLGGLALIMRRRRA
jgi:hypothetical protein